MALNIKGIFSVIETKIRKIRGSYTTVQIDPITPVHKETESDVSHERVEQKDKKSVSVKQLLNIFTKK